MAVLIPRFLPVMSKKVVAAEPTTHDFFAVARPGGGFWYVRKSGESGILDYVTNGGGGIDLTIPALADNGWTVGNTYVSTADNSPYLTRYGVASQQIVGGPGIPNLTALTANADGIVEMTFDHTAETYDILDFRRTDDDNKWYLQFLGDHWLMFRQVEGGVVTSRASGEYASLNNTTVRMLARFVDNVYEGYLNDSRKFTYTDAGNFNKGVVGAQVYYGHGASEAVSWPKTLATLPIG